MARPAGLMPSVDGASFTDRCSTYCSCPQPVRSVGASAVVGVPACTGFQLVPGSRLGPGGSRCRSHSLGGRSRATVVGGCQLSVLGGAATGRIVALLPWWSVVVVRP